MRLSVERLRWGLLAGALVLIVVLVGLVSYGRYRALKAYRRILARSGATITHDTNGITWSQAVKGHTVFVLHAAKAVPLGAGRYSLHDAALVLYDKAGAPMDRIYGSEFEYDQKQQTAKAMGDVQMDLQPPAGVSSVAHGKTRAGRENEQTIHVRTSGLVYVRKLGVASTGQEVEIAYQGMHGYARGAEFDSEHSVVHLLADVWAEGNFRGGPAVLTAAKADLDRSENVLRLTQPVVRSGGRVGSAVLATLYLRKDGSLQRVHAERDVTLRSGTRRITAAAVEAAMNAQSQAQRAELSGGVAVEDSSASRPMQGSARRMTIACDSAGAPKSVVAEGAVSMATQARAANGVVLHRQMAADRATVTLARVSGSSRRGHTVQASAIEATGSAWVRGESLVKAGGKAATHGGVKTTEIAADDLRLKLTANAAGRSEPESLAGAGHTRLEQKMPDGGEESSMGDALQLRFAARSSGASGSSAAGLGGEAGLEVASAEQDGHIALRSQRAAKPGAKGVAEVSTGSAMRAEFDGERDLVTLSGRPHLVRGDTDVAADRIVLEQSSGDATAHGAVSASFVKAGVAPGTPATHVVAADASLDRAAQTIEFRGTDAQPARLWQGASQLAAASVLLDRAHDTLVARPAAAGGLVHAVFASLRSTGNSSRGIGSHATGWHATVSSATESPAAGASGAVRDRRSAGLLGGEGSSRVVRVASARMDYMGASREAVFSGGVRSEGATGMVQAERGVVFLSPSGERAGASAGKVVSGGKKTPGEPDPLGGSVERMVLWGGVRLEQPGRHGTGEQLLYTASSGEFVLTGSPGRLPHVVDEKQGSVTGATLLFGSTDSTIIVAGEPASHGRVRGRVHTETQVKP